MSAHDTMMSFLFERRNQSILFVHSASLRDNADYVKDSVDGPLAIQYVQYNVSIISHFGLCNQVDQYKSLTII